MSKANLAIYIENPQLYTTGDTVKGNVQLTVEDQLNLESLEVSLLGIAKSRNHTYNNGSYTAGSEVHRLLQLTAKVFPPPDIQNVSSSKKFTLTNGEYSYPFEFTFPGIEHVAQCVQDKKTFHSKYYLNRDKRDAVTLVGSFYQQENSEDYCFVQYSIDAKINMASMFRFDIKHSEPVYFAPRNTDIVFSLLHICDKSKKLLGDEDYACQKVKYGIGDEAKEGKSFFRKLLSSNAVKVPFELKVRFKSVSPAETEKGTTSRVLEGGKRLSTLIDLDLTTPFSHQNLLDALGGNKAEKKGVLKSPVVRITHVKVKLISLLRFLGATETHSKIKHELLNQNLDVEVPLSDFEREEYNGTDLFFKTSSKYHDKIARNICYRLSLDPSWWDCYVNDIGQSFLTCSIRKNVELYIRLTIVSPDNPDKPIQIKSTSPIVFYRQEGSEGNVPYLNGGEHEQLPEYMPAPPQYDSDDNQETKGSRFFKNAK
ncbi:hypothetical protein FT663_04256 [Candidozyma haemuli var. vulneris]|uniref:Arrestin-like N-terminal domain-containing protein n=1 Tax=Candidozyma haemuli TaxID=45357 RepID=A0A2V1ASE9_9ASCO|nr:hypothetical protein CXQ85_004166 [[Candida] haemuloni]KAF3987894.1 hypothetical protein FT662_03725 [[Candida] haemuloni var. vulneris]KAF3987918.1 hypothetical protein FT663_04256 [[Candida] haemuloni var. vulneris]PVH20662.1 hypothetical protein CXQ85_004166 [[Candida] haemuloni]